MFSNDLFKDRRVLITGGRSGIGFGLAEKFLKHGAKVFICSRKEEPLQIALNKLKELGECHGMSCDIRNTEEIKRLTDNIKTVFGGLDILINNAGGQFPSLAEKISENGWNAVINTNLNGTFYITSKIANEFFIPQSSGTIVNITANVLRGLPGMAHTSAARAGVQNLSKTLAAEWAKYNIRINSIAPGTIISSGLDTYAGPVKELFDKIKEDNLMKRLGTIEDVSNATFFLASDLSSYTSGTTIYVDGMEHLHSNRMGLVDLLRQFE